MAKIAFIFPGQGSQKAGMGKEIHDQYPEAARIFEIANDTLGYDLKRKIFEGPGEELKKTIFTQPAVYTVSCAILGLVRKKGIKPDVVAGHSLGEYTAIYCAKGFDFVTGINLIKKRAEFIEQACDKYPGGMIAILGQKREAVIDFCKQAEGIVEPVNFNAPGQIVVAGEREALVRFGENLKEKGIKVIPLAVSGPFHCSLLKEASLRMAEEIERYRLKELEIPVVANVNGQLTRSSQDIKANLVKQISSPVLWEESVEKMVEAGVDTFIEIGPGKVLSGMIKRIKRDARCLNVEDQAGLNEVVENA